MEDPLQTIAEFTLLIVAFIAAVCGVVSAYRMAILMSHDPEDKYVIIEGVIALLAAITLIWLVTHYQ